MIPPPRAGFEPFPVDLKMKEIVETTDNFQYVERITCDSINSASRQDFEDLVRFYVVMRGVPLVIEGFQQYLDTQMFSRTWLQESDRSR